MPWAALSSKLLYGKTPFDTKVNVEELLDAQEAAVPVKATAGALGSVVTVMLVRLTDRLMRASAAALFVRFLRVRPANDCCTMRHGKT